ncbi:hypothetical protein Glove_426g97 [Diversispora epigaea]|uniref:Uncharacterized protein n=1 Tax=Diversispora epigaea TaxID=1348612 RepID=A0A397GWA8_9GLOM|nr:hypothetical protein Glove_426g97 [Diversispora epigaea]
MKVKQKKNNRNNEIIYISDDESRSSPRSNRINDIIQIEIDERPQNIDSLTFEEHASIQYEEPASREHEFETEESKFESNETESESDETESESNKTEFESDKTDNESNESEESKSAEEETETIPKFPNNTYSDLMTLIIQHNLNNKAGNAIIRFFNKHSNLPISLLPKNIEQGRKLMDRMKLINLLNKEKTNNNRNYNEQYTSNWWARTEKTLPTGSYLLSIILYSDASTTDSLGKNTLHPIFVTIGNIITWRRNKPDVKQLLAYLPIIKAKDDTQKISEEHKNIVRRTFHKSLKFLLSPLYDDNGIELELNNSIFWCFPRISMIISDWPEACTFALIYKLTKSNYPCHFCLVSKEDLSNINLNSNQIEPRSHNNMKLYYKNNTGKNVSIENVRNFFWSVLNINIYAATVSDRMHHLDLGLFQHQLNFTKILINKQCGKSVIDEMNNRVKLIPHYKDLKSFPNSFLHLTLLTASEYQSLMKIMIFIVDKFYEDSGSPNFIKNNKITEVYLKWNKMYLLSRKENYEESDVTLLQDNSEDNRNNEIIYISDDEPMFSSRSNETSDIMQVEIDERPQNIDSLTFEEHASIQYEEPASREHEFETEESKFESNETESESDETESESNKTEFESDKTDNESNESEESKSAEEETETIPKFPNNTYSDLMTLIIQHNLNNKAGNAIIRFFNKHSNLPISLLPKNIEQGRKLMDRMKLINLLNKEKVILKYNNKDYIIYYRLIINCIKNILSIKDIHKYITFNFKNDQTNNNRNYNEQYTSNWWARTEKTLPTGSYLLSIILYSDASTTDSLGKNTLHPIFVTIGNIITWRRNKPDVKQLLAYLPIIKAKDDTQKISEEHKNIVRRTFHKSLKFLLSPLYDDNGIELELNNSIFWCFPRISMIISDWPEACTFALIYKLTKSNYPCHFCLVSKEDLSNINLNSNQIEPRSHNNMKLYYKNNTGKNVSIENVRNFFWSVLNINIYAATVSDRMHHLDLGLFQHQLNFTKILINKQCGKSVIDEMNNRVKLIPHYKDLKSFPNSFLHLTLLTASEYQSLMKIMIFIVDKFYEDSGSPNFIKNNKITEVYLKWNKMYLLSRKENYEESDVTLLQKSINEWAKLFIELFKEHSKSELQFPKLHSWVFHICSSIREFGTINEYTTETYESLHKDYVKKPYKLTNKKEIEKQIIKIIRRKAIITEIEMNADEIFEYTSDNGVCFAQVLLITEIIMNYEEPMHLALVQWYNFTSSVNPYLYEYPLLEKTNIFNLIEIEAINDIIHIIPRFIDNNEFLVNKFLF